MKSSLINVFATFLLLTYNRLLDISFGLLIHTTAYNLRVEAVGRYLYYDSSKEFFGKQHRPFGILAIFMLITFNFMPFLLLLLYPMKWFQECLNFFRLSFFALHAFVDSFTGCYKDGTEPGTRDCCYFAAYFFLLRFANYVVLVYIHDVYTLIIIFICFSIVFVSAHPYKSKFSHHNTIMMVFLMIITVFCCCCFGYSYSLVAHHEAVHSLLGFFLHYPMLMWPAWCQIGCTLASNDRYCHPSDSVLDSNDFLACIIRPNFYELCTFCLSVCPHTLVDYVEVFIHVILSRLLLCTCNPYAIYI